MSRRSGVLMVKRNKVVVLKEEKQIWGSFKRNVLPFNNPRVGFYTNL